MKIEGFSKGDKADFEFGENAEYAIINCAKRSFEIDNKKLEEKIMYGTDSKFEIESFGQKLEDIDLENKSAKLKYDDVYQIKYYTEPYNDDHNLEINIL